MKHQQIKTSKSLVRDGEAFVDRFMTGAFFLPPDIIGDRDWEVQPVRLMSGEQFIRFMEEHQFDYSFRFQESLALLQVANRVGVSIRRHRPSNQTYVVAKLWYGKEPK